MSGFALAAVLSTMCFGQAGQPPRSNFDSWSSYDRYDAWDAPGTPAYRFPVQPGVPITDAPKAPSRMPSGKHYGPGNVRRDLSTLTADSPTLQSLRKGIDAMKKLPASDPHNWNNWANVHGFPEGTPNPDPLWGQCQHGNWWFLPWHRAYLVYFERVIRRYSEDPSFALPYWDYSVNRTLPAPYRDASSVLYDDSLRGAVNDGTDSLNPLVVVLGTNMSMGNTTFSDFGPILTFGGRALNAPQHTGNPHGAIEAVPHDLVHAFLGGNMNSPDLAARDPIFYAHHANVDRLWIAWLQQGQGRANPSDNGWLNQQFTFYDENKQRVTVAVRDLLDTAALGYSYDRSTSTANVPGRPAPQTAVETVAMLRTMNTRLQNQPVTLTLNIPNRQRSKAPGKAPSQFHLQMEEVTFMAPDSVVAVYVNLPPGTTIPGPSSTSYAGCFTFFGDHGHKGAMGMTSQIDVTRHLQGLWTKQPQQQQQSVTVTLVRMSPGLTRQDFKKPCTFNQISLTVTK